MTRSLQSGRTEDPERLPGFRHRATMSARRQSRRAVHRSGRARRQRAAAAPTLSVAALAGRSAAGRRSASQSSATAACGSPARVHGGRGRSAGAAGCCPQTVPKGSRLNCWKITPMCSPRNRSRPAADKLDKLVPRDHHLTRISNDRAADQRQKRRLARSAFPQKKDRFPVFHSKRSCGQAERRPPRPAEADVGQIEDWGPSCASSEHATQIERWCLPLHLEGLRTGG